MLVHLVGYAAHGLAPLADAAAAWPMWLALRRAFPRVWGACLMPSGVDLVADVSHVVDARRRLARVLGWHSRRAGQHRVWTPVPYPRAIPVRRQLFRHVRELHLRPCRAGLVPDPLSWPWSTHRGVMSAELDPWVSASLLGDEVGWPGAEFALHFHEHVSTDPDVSVAGTAPPVLAAEREISAVPLETIFRAALSATPWGSAALRRRAAVLLAKHQGWSSNARVARALDISPESVRRLALAPDPRLIRAAAACLGDPRLLFDSATAHALSSPLDAVARAPDCARSQHVQHSPTTPSAPSRHRALQPGAGRRALPGQARPG